jgi:hypothetical protein
LASGTYSRLKVNKACCNWQEATSVSDGDIKTLIFLIFTQSWGKKKRKETTDRTDEISFREKDLTRGYGIVAAFACWYTHSTRVVQLSAPWDGRISDRFTNASLFSETYTRKLQQIIMLCVAVSRYWNVQNLINCTAALAGIAHTWYGFAPSRCASALNCATHTLKLLFDVNQKEFGGFRAQNDRWNVYRIVINASLNLENSNAYI